MKGIKKIVTLFSLVAFVSAVFAPQSVVFADEKKKTAKVTTKEKAKPNKPNTKLDVRDVTIEKKQNDTDKKEFSLLRFLGIEQLTNSVLGSATLVALLPILTAALPFIGTTFTVVAANAHEAHLVRLSDDAAAFLGGQPASTLLELNIRDIRERAIKITHLKGKKVSQRVADVRFSDKKIVKNMYKQMKTVLKKFDTIRKTASKRK